MLQPVIVHSAINDSNIEKLKSLIEGGIDINIKDQNGYSPIHQAVRNNSTKLVEFLLEQKEIDQNIIDSEGNSPLYYSCFNGNIGLTDFLVSKGGLFKTDAIKLGDTL